jgi:hypothetical protein
VQRLVTSALDRPASALRRAPLAAAVRAAFMSTTRISAKLLANREVGSQLVDLDK